MEIRVLPLRKYYSEWVRTISSIRTTLHILLVLFLSVGSGLGAFGFSLWMPIPLAMATLVTTLIHWLVPSEMLIAVNNAMTTLNNLDLRWKGSDVMENRLDATRSHLIQTTEKLWWAVATTYTGSSLIPEELEDEVYDSLRSPRTSPEAKKELYSRGSSRATSGVNTPFGRSGTITPYGSYG